MSGLNFSCSYLIEALFRQKYVLRLQGIQDFVDTAIRLYKVDKQLVEAALSDLVLVMERVYPINLSVSLEIWFSSLQKYGIKDMLSTFVPSDTEFIRRVVLTPTRVLLYPKELIQGNRILRRFDPEYAIRVSFRDDDFAKLNTTLPLSESINSSMITKRMIKGLRIACRKYEFLAWSNSQVRDHSVWMYAEDEEGQTSETIREWMGDFSEIKNVAKYMARMGQCFSHTTETISIRLTSQKVGYEPDIERGRDNETGKPYCFSDGIGRISQETANEVCNVLKLKQKPSAFQIRYSGVKGMVVTDPNLEGKKIVFRNSMVKFESICDKLEIVKYSSPCKVALNRPMIAILEDRGIKPEVFLKIQNDYLKALTEMLLDSEKAVSYLAGHNNLPGVDLMDVHDSGIDLASEPFFRKMLLARHDHDITRLRKKACLPIDPSEGRNMFGVLDETGSLRYGQVFVQFTTDIYIDTSSKEVTKIAGPATRVLTGKVLVSKNPCYLAGDVRIFDCIDVPALHHIVDCVVFPQRGRRPHPNELSGSDLDGDEYTVIWKNELLFARNAEPGQFPSPQGKKHKYEIEVPDMVNFLKEFINNDRIGYISHCHLAMSDRLGVQSPTCIELARYCSMAVDFPKTGCPVNLNKDLRPTMYPDFMEKTRRECYPSQKILGELFRACRDFQSASSAVTYVYEPVQVDPDLKYPGWEEFGVEAKSTLASYENCMLQLLGTYGVKHESEAMSGAFSSIHSRFKESNDRFDTQKIVAIYIRALWKKYKKDFWTKLRNEENVPSKALSKVSAYYILTYTQKKPLVLSLPWIFSRQLAQIKQLKVSEGRKELVSPLFEKLNAELERYSFEIPNIVPRIVHYLLPDFPKNKYETLRKAAGVTHHWAKEVDVMDESKENLAIAFLASMVYHKTKSERVLSLFLSLLQSDFWDLEIGKFALRTYRDVAVSANLSCLNMGEGSTENEIMEMEPIRVQVKRVGSDKPLIQTLLLEQSRVDTVDIRKDGNWQYVISARGHPTCIRELENFLWLGDKHLENAVAEEVAEKRRQRRRAKRYRQYNGNIDHQQSLYCSDDEDSE